MTPLMWAIQKGKGCCAGILLEVCDLDARDASGHAAMDFALGRPEGDALRRMVMRACCAWEEKKLARACSEAGAKAQRPGL